MDELTDFEIIGQRGYLRPRSFQSVDHAVDAVDTALAFARARGLREVLADVTALARFPSPTVVERFWIVSRWAQTAGWVRLAVVACPGHIDAQRFGVTVARNRGLTGNVFLAEAEAVEWLEAMQAEKVASQINPAVLRHNGVFQLGTWIHLNDPDSAEVPSNVWDKILTDSQQPDATEGNFELDEFKWKWRR